MGRALTPVVGWWVNSEIMKHLSLVGFWWTLAVP